MRTLTKRQRQVLERLVIGRPNKLIAAELGITEQCVKAHVSKLFAKFHVHNRVALTHAVDVESDDLRPERTERADELARLANTFEEMLAAVPHLQPGLPARATTEENAPRPAVSGGRFAEYLHRPQGQPAVAHERNRG